MPLYSTIVPLGLPSGYYYVMTQLSDQAVEEYQEIYFKEYGERISKEEARIQGTKLANLFKIIYKPIPEAKNE